MTKLVISIFFALFISGCAAKQIYIPVPQEPKNGTEETKPEKSTDDEAAGKAAAEEFLKTNPPEEK
ncbi:hypothetical protein LCGC14_2206560 [marine sediment metagenome]|uniref:Lipoprotein n=1 Tax=marine sediment metagenome TaxID=412755 RepID=A0A0F9GB06_9ZZZZ